MYVDIEALDEMQFEEVELPEIQIAAEAPSVDAASPAVVEPSDVVVQEPAADPLSLPIETLDTDFSDRPKATFNPFDQ